MSYVASVEQPWLNLEEQPYCQNLRVLASWIDKRIILAEYFYNILWKILFQLTSLWDNSSTGALSKAYVRSPTRFRRSSYYVVCLIDDIFIYGKTQEEHDKHLITALHKIAEAGIILNEEKCDISQNQVKFLGQIVDSNDIHPDPGKVMAVKQMNTPTNITELHHFLGMLNQLVKFTP